jgi:hypothetical protein
MGASWTPETPCKTRTSETRNKETARSFFAIFISYVTIPLANDVTITRLAPAKKQMAPNRDSI